MKLLFNWLPHDFNWLSLIFSRSKLPFEAHTWQKWLDLLHLVRLIDLISFVMHQIVIFKFINIFEKYLSIIIIICLNEIILMRIFTSLHFPFFFS